MTEPQTPPEPGPDNPHTIPGDVLQECLDEAAESQKQAQE